MYNLSTTVGACLGSIYIVQSADDVVIVKSIKEYAVGPRASESQQQVTYTKLGSKRRHWSELSYGSGLWIRIYLCKGLKWCEPSGVEGYITEAEVGLCDHKTIMVEGVVGWTIHCFIGSMMFSRNKPLILLNHSLAF